MRTAGLAFALLCAAQAAEILDRIAVTVDDRLITLSDVLQEIRIAALLDASPLAFTPERKRQAAERLVDALLLTRDMEFTRFPSPSPEDVDAFIQQIRHSRKLDSAAWQTQLAHYGVSELTLREHLTRRLALLRYIEFRFRPEAQVSEAEIRQHALNRLLLPGAAASYDEARRAAEAALAAQRVDQLVDAWLKDARRRARIRYREGALQ